jgi:outer membrane protein assembly factor BamE
MNKVANDKVLSPSKGFKLSGSRLGKFIATTALISLVGCSSGKWGFPYRAPTQQGNWVTAEQASYLRPGLTQAQVLYALGTPSLVDIFRPNRWDYPYHFKPGYGEPVHRNLSLWFDENGLLERWQHDPLPETQPADFESQRSSGRSTFAEAESNAAATVDSSLQGDTEFETTPLAD